MNDKIKLAVISFEDSSWSGGIISQNNLTYALDKYSDTIEYKVVKPIVHKDIATSNIFNRIKNYADSQIKENIQKKYYYDHELEKNITKNAFPDYDAVYLLGSAILPKGKAVISWIPDLQHLHLRHMFSMNELKWRDQDCLKAGENATFVVLSSYKAEHDYHSFAPEYEHKTRVLHFASYSSPEVYDGNIKEIIDLYKLPEKFIFLPNQFWKHKNHDSVFKALKALKNKNIKPILVCSGNTHDYRDLNFFDYLNSKISGYGIHELVKILGLIPYQHVQQLMRQSICVINPSLFEGWSNTVEEVKSIGKRVLLSSIDVHKEQNPPYAEYFDPLNIEEIARLLKSAWENYKTGPDLELEEEARKNMPERIKTFAEDFESIITDAVSTACSK